MKAEGTVGAPTCFFSHWWIPLLGCDLRLVRESGLYCNSVILHLKIWEGVEDTGLDLMNRDKTLPATETQRVEEGV
jgi:hypothetical protein